MLVVQLTACDSLMQIIWVSEKISGIIALSGEKIFSINIIWVPNEQMY